MSLCLSAVAAARRTILHTTVMIIVIIASHIAAACQEYNGFAYLSSGSNVALVCKR